MQSDLHEQRTQEDFEDLLDQIKLTVLQNKDRSQAAAQLLHGAMELIAQAEVVADGNTEVKAAAVKLAATFRDAMPLRVAPAMQQRSAQKHYQARRVRDRLFSTELFGEPAWDMLLDLFLSECLDKQVCITSASIAAAVPSTTGIRWVRLLEAEGWIVRSADPTDARRFWLSLTDKGRGLLERYFLELAGRNLL